MGAAVSDPLYLTAISQVGSEFQQLLDLFRREQVTRFLEIGSRYGGSLWRIASIMPKGSLIVSVDSGKGMGGRKPGASESLKDCVAELRRLGHEAHLFVGHSQDERIVSQVAGLAPFDAVFIDGDHALPGVTRDWENFGQMARVVAFHDVGFIKPADYSNAKMVEVPILWDRIKRRFRHVEFIDRSTGGNMGIGVLWR